MAAPQDAGRTHYPDLDAALAALPVAHEQRSEVVSLVGKIPSHRVWIPASWTYIALAPPEGPVAAYVNRTFVDVRRPDGEHDRHELAGYTESAPSARPATAGGALGAWGETCPTCHLSMSLAGVCEDCA